MHYPNLKTFYSVEKFSNFTEMKCFMEKKCYNASLTCTHLRKLMVVGAESFRLESNKSFTIALQSERHYSFERRYIKLYELVFL